jgi:hypothetical protein
MMLLMLMLLMMLMLLRLKTRWFCARIDRVSLVLVL